MQKPRSKKSSKKKEVAPKKQLRRPKNSVQVKAKVIEEFTNNRLLKKLIEKKVVVLKNGEFFIPVKAVNKFDNEKSALRHRRVRAMEFEGGELIFKGTGARDRLRYGYYNSSGLGGRKYWGFYRISTAVKAAKNAKDLKVVFEQAIRKDPIAKQVILDLKKIEQERLELVEKDPDSSRRKENLKDETSVFPFQELVALFELQQLPIEKSSYTKKPTKQKTRGIQLKKKIKDALKDLILDRKAIEELEGNLSVYITYAKTNNRIAEGTFENFLLNKIQGRTKEDSIQILQNYSRKVFLKVMLGTYLAHKKLDRAFCEEKSEFGNSLIAQNISQRGEIFDLDTMSKLTSEKQFEDLKNLGQTVDFVSNRVKKVLSEYHELTDSDVLKLKVFFAKQKRDIGKILN